MTIRQNTVVTFLALLAIGLGSMSCKKQTETKTSGDEAIALQNALPEAPDAGLGGDPLTPDQTEAALTTLYLGKIHFEFDRAVLTTEAKETLQANANILRDNSDVQIQIEGHCDARGSTDYNLALGERRASIVRTYLVNLGVPSSNVVILSLGEERPLTPGSGEGIWSQNRRAESVVIQGNSKVLGSTTTE